MTIYRTLKTEKNAATRNVFAAKNSLKCTHSPEPK